MDRKNNNKKIFWYLIFLIFLVISIYQSYFVYFTDITSTKSKWIALISGVLGLLFSSCKVLEFLFVNSENKETDKIENCFLNGFKILFKKSFLTILPLGIVICLLLIKYFGKIYALSFACGLFLSYPCIILTNYLSLKASIINQYNSKNSKDFIFKISKESSICCAFLFTAALNIPIVILYHLSKDYQVLYSFLAGIALSSLSCAICPVIIKKAAKSANNVINKITDSMEANDIRNPLLLLHGVSELGFNHTPFNFDLLLSFACVIVAAISVGAMTLNLMGAFLPLIIVSNIIFCTIISILFIEAFKPKDIKRTFLLINILTSLSTIILTSVCIKFWFLETLCLTLPFALGVIVAAVLKYSGSKNFSINSLSVINTVNASYLGQQYIFFQTLKESFKRSIAPLFILLFGFVSSFFLARGLTTPLFGIYGMIIFIMGYFVPSINIIIKNTFGNIVSDFDYTNSAYEGKTTEYKNKFKVEGRFFSSSVKNYINGASFLSFLALFIALYIISSVLEINILNPYTLTSIFTGSIVPFLICALVMSITAKTTTRLVLEIKRQFRRYPQILGFKMRPKYENCIDTAYNISSFAVIFYMVLIIVIFALIFKYFKIDSIEGLILGIAISGFGFIFFISNSSEIALGALNYSQKEYPDLYSSNESEIIKTNNLLFSINNELLCVCLNFAAKFFAIAAMVFLPLFM